MTMSFLILHYPLVANEGRLMHAKIIYELSIGEPLARIWPSYIAFGALAFGFFSIPSEGAAIVLIPMFFISGTLIGYGSLICPATETPILGKQLTVAGLSLMVVCSWTRALSLWGVPQDGVGSNAIATIVWLWIMVGCALLLVSIWLRGLV